MDFFDLHRRRKFFLAINVTGLAIGLAVSIMLILFVVNELSYDSHFAKSDRIVRLLTKYDDNYTPICLRQAYTELPANVSGIEAATQIYNVGKMEVSADDEKRFKNVRTFLADPEIFKVFEMKFIEGSPNTAAQPKTAVITRRHAEIIFGSPADAMNKQLSFWDENFVVTGVVEEMPKNTHFAFDLIITDMLFLGEARGLEFHTYYLIKPEASLELVRTEIAKAYLPILKPWKDRNNLPDAHGITEKLSEVYLSPNTQHCLGASSSMSFIWILTGLAFFILILAVANFTNMYVVQGETRSREIGVRKTFGAMQGNIVKQFFSEVSRIVALAFFIGLFFAITAVPYFNELINKDVDLIQLLNPGFILALILLFALTVGMSAFYPAIYLSRFSPLEILGKRIAFSKRRLTAAIVVFQSVVSIVLLAVIFVLYRQTSYLEKLPLGYNPENVMMFNGNRTINSNFNALQQELLQYPEVEAVSGGHHRFGGGCSGQSISLWGDEKTTIPINEYRLMQGVPEIMQLELVEGRFWRENDPDSISLVILNQAAVKALDAQSPLDRTFDYHGHQTKVIGVVKDFYYDNPVLNIEPIILTRIYESRTAYIRFNDRVNRLEAQAIITEVLRKLDDEFVLDPVWAEDVYAAKFKELKTMTLIVLISSVISIFIAMLGLLAIHLFSVVRRTKEIGIRRVLGAEKRSVFALLSFDVLKWIGLAAIIAVPIAVYILSKILNNYANRVDLDWSMFVFPFIIQCVIALMTTSGVSLNVMSKNPVESLKSE